MEETEELIEDLKIEQARGNYQIAAWYEKKKKWKAALIYYNEVTIKAPASTYYYDLALGKIDKITKILQVKNSEGS